MAQVRAAVVNTNVLAEVAAELELGGAVRLGRGEATSGGRGKASILADSFEAVIGAIYLDGGWDAAQRFVMEHLGRRIEAAAIGPGSDDHKTRLQELVVHMHGHAPRYDVVGSGPDHDRRFTANVFVAGSLVGSGVGRSKKDAEQAAAKSAWKILDSTPSLAAKKSSAANGRVHPVSASGSSTTTEDLPEALVSDA
jgi:ribonuclease-3